MENENIYIIMSAGAFEYEPNGYIDDFDELKQKLKVDWDIPDECLSMDLYELNDWFDENMFETKIIEVEPYK